MDIEVDRRDRMTVQRLPETWHLCGRFPMVRWRDIVIRIVFGLTDPPTGRAWCVSFAGLVAVLVALVAGSDSPVVASDSEYTPERFLAECKAGLAKLEERSRHCHGRYRLIDGGAILGWQNIDDIEFAVSDDQLLLKTHYTLEKRQGKPDEAHDRWAVWASNAEYGFHITMRNETGQYRLDEYELASETASMPPGGKIRNRITYYIAPPLVTHWMGFFPLGPFLSHPSFRFVKLSDRVRDGVKVVRVEFDCRPHEPKTDPRVSWTRDKVFGWFEVAPTEGWTVRAFEYTYFAAGATPEVSLMKARVIGDIGYAPGLDGLPIVARYKQATAWLDKPPDAYIEIDDVHQEFGPTPSEQFRLSYYNLPEPFGIPPLSKARSHIYWWLLAAAGGFTAAAVAFHWLGRRRTPQPPTSSGV